MVVIYGFKEQKPNIFIMMPITGGHHGDLSVRRGRMEKEVAT
jgi:hypothetical protein